LTFLPLIHTEEIAAETPGPNADEDQGVIFMQVPLVVRRKARPGPQQPLVFSAWLTMSVSANYDQFCSKRLRRQHHT
jgi:hypothetical protein